MTTCKGCGGVDGHSLGCPFASEEYKRNQRYRLDNLAREIDKLSNQMRDIENGR